MNDLIKSIHRAANVYLLAAQNVELTVIRKHLKKLGVKKEKHFSTVSMGEKNELPQQQLETIQEGFPHISYDDLTEKWLVSCLLYEEEVIKAFQKLLISGELDKNHEQLYHSLLHDSLVTYNQLKSLKESRHYQ